MKGTLLFLMACVVVVTSSEDYCIDSTEKACNQDAGSGLASIIKCNAIYGGFNHLKTDLQGFANVNLKYSYNYLLIASYFNNYKKARAGFRKVFKDLSDKAWEDTIGLIKHITKRGGKMDFNSMVNGHGIRHKENSTIELDEIAAVAYALDTEKTLASLSHHIHNEASKNNLYDPEIASYLEEHFMEKQAEDIRKLSGYTNDLKNLYANQADNSLATYLFDEYLTKL